MSGQKLVDGVAVFISFGLLFPGMSVGSDLKIKQEGYRYKMPYTQNVYKNTFVISPASEPKQPDSPEPVEAVYAEEFTDPIVVYFEIDSQMITPAEASKIRDELRTLEVPPNAPLVVTGFTCKKGSDHINERLSNARARAVARFLDKEGYNVAIVEGRGADPLVSEMHHPLNRRVEIMAIKN